ncbi:Putative transposase of IS4/5 family [Nitratireductor aquibiodomus]|uniref:Putative transposase of IS4/5 family n=1 Tax=Nitratireductor aquibiodomus TaxID=204799 RepID=A0A1H4LRD1_9HYPH|nr:Putative transposase of IS4/5 family [Nitratireductor aquibiodomus]
MGLRILNAVQIRLKAGFLKPAMVGPMWMACRHWHNLPKRYGKWKTVHKRFTRCSKAGVPNGFSLTPSTTPITITSGSAGFSLHLLVYRTPL